MVLRRVDTIASGEVGTDSLDMVKFYFCEVNDIRKMKKRQKAV